ncbi:MAG TPA: GFA family protein [Dongiaceae bacterium]|jgi:hypothetical protein
MKIDGTCHCGAIAYEAEVDPQKVEICHCTDCQALTGTTFRTSVPAQEDSFRILKGSPKTYVKTGDSGNRREQGFCRTCGTPIYSTSAGEGPKAYNLRVGSMRQRDCLAPTAQYWVRSAQRWLPTLDSLPKVEKE